MRLNLQDLSAGNADLVLPAPLEGQRSVRLESLAGGRGLVEVLEESYRLRPVSARHLVVSGGSWSLPFGAITVERPATLEGIELDFTAGAAGFDGTMSFARVGIEGLALDVSGLRLSGDLAVSHLSVEYTGERGGQASSETLAIKNVKLAIGDVFLEARALTAESVRVRWAQGSWAVEADRAFLEGASFSLEDRGLKIDLERLELPGWLSVRGDVVRFGELRLDQARLEIDHLSSLGGKKGPRPQIDLKFLDHANGRLDADLTLDATVPLIGRRKATHHFRVPIHDGTINYRELERDLAALEDAVIDFAVRDGKLVLERDLPLIPGMHKPILLWDLSEVELALAKQRLLRLRTAPRYRLPQRDPDSKKSRFSLRRAHVRNLDASLSLDTPLSTAPLQGALTSVSAEAITVCGEAHHHVERDIAPTELRAGGKNLALGLQGWPISDWALFAESLELESLEDVVLTMKGFQPRRLTATLRSLSGRSIELTRDGGS